MLLYKVFCFSEALNRKDTRNKNAPGGRYDVWYRMWLSRLSTSRRGHVVQEQPSAEKSQGKSWNNISGKSCKIIYLHTSMCFLNISTGHLKKINLYLPFTKWWSVNLGFISLDYYFRWTSRRQEV